MTDVFKAISDETRRSILLMIAQQPSSINQVAQQFKMSRPAVSKHIKLLELTGLIDVRESTSDARQRICYATLDALIEVRLYLESLELFWEKKLDALEQHLDNMSPKS